MAYCTVADLSGLTQPNYPYATDTKPSKAQVQGFIDRITDDIDLKIQSSGYVLPIADETALGWLKLVNMWGAGAMAEAATAAQNNAPLPAQAETWWSWYQAALIRMSSEPGALGQSVDRTGGMPRALWTQHSLDGSEDGYSSNIPWFTRDTTF